jgi:hypothetical protein
MSFCPDFRVSSRKSPDLRSILAIRCVTATGNPYISVGDYATAIRRAIAAMSARPPGHDNHKAGIQPDFNNFVFCASLPVAVPATIDSKNPTWNVGLNIKPH